MSRLIIKFRENDIKEWCVPEGKEWNELIDQANKDLGGNNTIGEVENHVLSDISPKFDNKVYEIISDITKDTNLHRSDDTYIEWYGRVYEYKYELDNNISEETLTTIKEKIEEELIDVYNICLEG